MGIGRRHKQEGGSGGKRGHSNMDHWMTTEETKDAARKRRRLDADAVVNEQLAATSIAEDWCDATLRSINWDSEATSLVLVFQDAQNQLRTMRCRHPQGVEINLRNPLNDASPPLTWEAALKQHNTHDWTITFDFAAQGTITLRCSSFTVE